ncbi:hypothetical protein [Deinococcus soli (ex Cha et al. 2016)]|uniref:hypothetical protein n=1 Tax=Deinococcus soli (ex Cha et al. 2016) TaxID=1309411 RepID=UPI0016648B09|nr:hypothetical protein [Deinococcus soli (ex Cha et al. 2016)]GGB68932.1 hypothetical protein GCM10008019_26460 [Deinococcus soli (ex Cha et al. 2016)]
MITPTPHAFALAALSHEPRNVLIWGVHGSARELACRVAVRREFAALLLFGRPLGSWGQLWAANWQRTLAARAAQDAR